MTFYIANRSKVELRRIVQAVTISARNSLGLNGGDGWAVKAVVDAQANLIGDKPFYCVEESGGSLVGYFSLDINGNTATLQSKQFRKQYQQFDAQITNQIATFIQGRDWQFDFLK